MRRRLLSPSLTLRFRADARAPLFACPNKGTKQKAPNKPPAMPVHSDARANGMQQKLGRLLPSSNTLLHRRCAPDTRCHCASPSPYNGLFNLENSTTPCLYLAPWAQRRAAEPGSDEAAGCLSAASSGGALTGEQHRASMRSIDARQGVFCFGYFHLDKQMKVTRTAVRNAVSSGHSIHARPRLETLRFQLLPK